MRGEGREGEALFLAFVGRGPERLKTPGEHGVPLRFNGPESEEGNRFSSGRKPLKPGGLAGRFFF
jgi:hypothetical protein